MRGSTGSFASLRETANALRIEIEAGEAQSGAMTGSAQALGAALAEVTRQLRDEMPPAMAGIEIQAERTAASADAVVARMERMESAAGNAAERVAESEAGVARQREALDALLATVREGAAEAEARLGELGALIGEADGKAERLIKETGPELIDALIRVRDAANQAAGHAREAIAAAIPDSVAALADADPRRARRGGAAAGPGAARRARQCLAPGAGHGQGGERAADPAIADHRRDRGGDRGADRRGPRRARGQGGARDVAARRR